MEIKLSEKPRGGYKEKTMFDKKNHSTFNFVKYLKWQIFIFQNN